MIKRIVLFLNRNRFMEIYFSNYKWCRKAIGGRWERWHIECVHSVEWIRWDSSTKGRPGTGFGTPLVEEY